jgi:hypothetical protein
MIRRFFVSSMNLLWIIIIYLIFSLFEGCDIDDNDTELDDNLVPTITIERVPIEGSGWVISFGDAELEEEIKKDIALMRLNVNPEPKMDLAVIVQFVKFIDVEIDPGEKVQTTQSHTRWVVIPKSEKKSSIFEASISAHDRVSIRKLPMITVIGEGRIVDLEELQESLPDTSVNGVLIPKDYNFPIYDVEEPSLISLNSGE